MDLLLAESKGPSHTNMREHGISILSIEYPGYGVLHFQIVDGKANDKRIDPNPTDLANVARRVMNYVL